MSMGKTVNFVGFYSQREKEGTIWEGKTVEDRSVEEVAAAFGGWTPEAEQLIKVRSFDHAFLSFN